MLASKSFKTAGQGGNFIEDGRKEVGGGGKRKSSKTVRQNVWREK